MRTNLLTAQMEPQMDVAQSDSMRLPMHDCVHNTCKTFYTFQVVDSNA